MTILEAAAMAAILGVAVLCLMGQPTSVIVWTLMAVGGVCLGLAVGSNPFRWQLAPTVLAILVLILFVTLAKGEARWVPGVAIALVAIGAFLVDGFRVRSLPAPSGNFAVGSTSLVTERNGGLNIEPAESRSLFVKVWYPAKIEKPNFGRESLWADMRTMQDVPAPMRLILRYLSGAKTHTIQRATFLPTDASHPVLIYNHGLISWASDNSLLLEDLASRGYVVVSVRHMGQSEEYQHIQANLSDAERMRDKEIYAALSKAASRSERAQLSQELVRNSTGMAEVVRRRAADTKFVMDNLAEVLAGVPAGSVPNSIDVERFGAIGLSLGGAVATLACAQDERCVGVVNLDGGLFGNDQMTAHPQPYLMIYSGDNVGGNDVARDAVFGAYSEIAFPDAKHMNLHDASVSLPILRWVGALSHSDGAKLNRRLSEHVAAFFDSIFR